MKNIEEIIEMMKSINPEIKMDWNFKRALKNKLEITAFSKIKNTKNKKINIAKSWFFSFKKDNKNIFEKPKLNFVKILSPIFVWALAVFWFINFYWTDLFISEKWNNFNYEVEKNIQRKVPVPIIKKLSPGTGTDKFIKENSIVNTDNSIKDEIINTEIIDLLWNNESIEEKIRPVSEDRMWNIETGLEYNNIELFEFEDFCNSKNWEILNNICTYWKVKCSFENFEKNKCDEK